MTIEISPEIEKQLNLWSMAVNEPPEIFIEETLRKALEDWEDYQDAVKICDEIDSGRIKTYTQEEVWRELDEMDG